MTSESVTIQSYSSLQDAVWKKIQNITTSDKKRTRAQYKLHTLALCEIMENKWNTFATENPKHSSQKITETNLYYTKTQKEVIVLPEDIATAFVDKYYINALKTHQDKFTKSMNEIFAKDPDIKRLSPEEINKIQEEESESDCESERSCASDDEY